MEGESSAQIQQRTKLHGIYNALDIHNYTRAVKLTQHKTICSLHITLALKSHAYERLGKREESLVVITRLLLPFFACDVGAVYDCSDLMNVLEGEEEDRDRDLVDLMDGVVDDVDNNNERVSKSTSNNTSVKKISNESDVITDETTISTIAITLRAYRLYKTLVSMYSCVLSSIDKNDANIALFQQQLFFSQLRYSLYNNNTPCFDAMQNTALQLAKQDDTTSLYFTWAASCTSLKLLYHKTNLSEVEKDLSLRLAEGLAKKVITTTQQSDQTSAEDWRLYISFLIEQKKYTQVIDIIQTQLNSTTLTSSTNNIIQMTNREKKDILASCATSAASNKQESDYYTTLAYDTYLELVKETNYNNFGIGKQLLLCASNNISNPMDKLIQCREDVLLSKILSLKEDKKENIERKRGVYLLVLEGYAIHIRHYTNSSEDGKEVGPSLPTSLLEEFKNQMIQYMQLFSSVTFCCFDDLKPYLLLLKQLYKKNEMLFDTILQYTNQVMTRMKQLLLVQEDKLMDKGALLEYITACHVSFTILFDSDVVRIDDMCSKNDFPSVDDLLSVWEWSNRDILTNGAVSSPDGSGQREILPGDELILLICSLLFHYHDKHHSNQQSSTNITSTETATHVSVVSPYLIQAGAILENALEISPFNHILKIYLIHVYAKLGVAQRALELFKSLDIKQIQLDSLSYLLIPIAINCGFYSDAVYQCTSVLNLHRTTSIVNVPDFIEKAFLNGNITQVYDMISFQLTKMLPSLQLYVVKGVILDMAPLCGASLGEHGLVGNVKQDCLTATKIIKEVKDHFGAPSLLNVKATRNMSDNRQFLNDRLISYYTTKEKLLTDTFSRQYVHNVLVRIALIPSAAISNRKKKNKVSSISPILMKRCKSLQNALNVANEKGDFKDDLLWNAVSSLSQVVIDISLSKQQQQDNDDKDNAENDNIVSVLNDATSKINEMHDNFKNSHPQNNEQYYIRPEILKIICNILPSRILPLITTLETLGALFHSKGYTKKKTQTSKESYALAQIAKSIKTVLDYFLVILCSNAPSTEASTSIISAYTSLLDNDNTLSTKISKEQIKKIGDNILTSQQLSRDKIVPFLEQMIDKLKVYVTEL